MSIGRRAIWAAAAVALAATCAGCGATEATPNTDTATVSGSARPAGAQRLPTGAKHVAIDPDDFTKEIDNRYWPMHPGNARDARGSAPAVMRPAH